MSAAKKRVLKIKGTRKRVLKMRGARKGSLKAAATPHCSAYNSNYRSQYVIDSLSGFEKKCLTLLQTIQHNNGVAVDDVTPDMAAKLLNANLVFIENRRHHITLRSYMQLTRRATEMLQAPPTKL